MIELIDQRKPGELKYRCTECGAEFISPPHRIHLHECKEPAAPSVAAAKIRKARAKTAP